MTMSHSMRCRCLAGMILWGAWTLVVSATAAGPLRVHPTNRRYFTDGTTNADGSLKAVYLGGHQIFVDLQDNSFNKEWTKDMNHPEDPAAKARVLDWDRYVDFAANQRFNYLRGWIIWSTGSGKAAPPYRVARPMPFHRTGPGTASDGSPKFDLHRFDEAFFRRAHDRGRALQERGVYLSVMLFELYGFLDGEAVDGQRLWDGNVLNGVNNTNGLDVDRNRNRLGEEFFSLEHPEVVKIQKAYLEKMVDALKDLDNVLWEICNEAPSASIAWQYEMLRHLKAYEARKPKQHLILLSPGGWVPGGGPGHPKRSSSKARRIASRRRTAGLTRSTPRLTGSRSPFSWTWTTSPRGAATRPSSGKPSPGATISACTITLSSNLRTRAQPGRWLAPTSGRRASLQAGSATWLG